MFQAIGLSGLSLRRLESETRPFCVRFVVEIVAEGEVCLSFSLFSVSVILPMIYVFSFIYRRCHITVTKHSIIK
jgi:hypothetical protein